MLGIDLSDPYTVSMLSRTGDMRSVIRSIAFFTGFVLLAILLIVISPRDSRPRKPLVERIYTNLRILSRVAGVKVTRSQTPQELGHQLVNYFPGSTQDIGTITDIYIRYRYGPNKLLSPWEEQELSEIWSPLRKRLVFRILSRIKPWGRPTNFSGTRVEFNGRHSSQMHREQTP